MKRSTGCDVAAVRDKENCENTIAVKERRDSVFKLQEVGVDHLKLQEANAKLAEMGARLVQKEQAFEQAAATQREAHALLEKLRADLDEARRQARRKDAVEKELQQLVEEKNAHLAELAKAQEQREELREHCAGLEVQAQLCAGLETQNGELQQRLRSLERQQANAERSLSQADKDKQAELVEKDQRLHELESLMHVKDQRLHEMDCLIHDKDQTLQQQRHEFQKQDAAMQAQVHDLQVELGEVRRRLAREQASHEKDLEAAARRTAAVEEAAKVAAEKDTAERAEEAAKRAECKEIRSLRQKLQHQHGVIESLGCELRKTASLASLMTPGEFGRMMKSTEAKNHFSDENARLFSRNAELETDGMLIRKENALLRRRLPADVCEALRREAATWAAHADAGGAQPMPEPPP